MKATLNILRKTKNLILQKIQKHDKLYCFQEGAGVDREGKKHCGYPGKCAGHRKSIAKSLKNHRKTKENH